MPMAIPFVTTATIREAEADYHFFSDQFEGARSISTSESLEKTGEWSDYAVGVLNELKILGITPPPCSIKLAGDVPFGAGLSSSASVEVATALALLAHSRVSLPPKEIALLCQRAENNFVGSPCGIMDQFVITAATSGHALLLNTRDLTTEVLPMTEGQLAACSVVVGNSGVKHSIAGGDYGVRRRELEAGQKVLTQRYSHLKDLGDATLEQLGESQTAMSSESFRRCRHVISENLRVKSAAEAMRTGDAAGLGELMHASHVSQRDDFQCSVPEIDFLVESAMRLEGCHGARLTGGGFGGCTVSLVENQRIPAFAAALRNAYRVRFGIELDTYVCRAVDGAVARNAPRKRANKLEEAP